MIIGARTGAWNGSWKNPYITDGLVAMWDGEWNAGGGIHDANASVWKDIANGGNDATLTTDTEIGDNYISTLGDTALNFNASKSLRSTWEDGSISVQLVSKISESYKDGAVIIGDNKLYRFAIALMGVRKRGTVDSCKCYFYGPHSATSSVFREDQVFSMSGLGTSIGSSSFVRGDGNKLTVYNVTSAKYNFTGKHYYSTMNTKCALLKNMIGTIYNIRVYNRPITKVEIAHNYAIDKARFNLP